MTKKRQKGTCHICGQTGFLSFEHIPPKSAYNKKTLVQYNLEDKIRKANVKGRKIQGGVGAYTLCETCNNDTGSWYASEYVRWASIGYDTLKILHKDHKLFGDKHELAVVFKEVYPLRFLKQVVVLFFSVSSGPNGLSKNYPKLAEFVLDKESTDLPDGFRFFIRLFESPSVRRMPIAGKITVAFNKSPDGQLTNLRPVSSNVFSEITHRPFALVMTMDGEDFSDATEITSFKEHSYNTQVDLPLTLKVSRKTSHYPVDY